MTVTSPPLARRALRLAITGVVQGVGFRPFLHRLAERHGLAGWVRNEAGQVRIEIEGSPEQVREFVRNLHTDAPPLARIESLDVAECAPQHVEGFRIVDSVDQPDERQPVSPDVALCPACEAELLDPENRRFQYPFITCTDCGPRFTVIEAMPYDRERTSMRVFAQCHACMKEYHCSSDRRFHSESNGCAACGPTVWLEAGGSAAGAVTSATAIERAAALLRAGRIVAIRGLGGFHLAVDATNQQAVERLRIRKAREAKPLAVMVGSLEEAARLGEVGVTEARALTSRERPIVLLRTPGRNSLAEGVAPDLDTVGVMIAYTPLHRLLLDFVGRPLVMTSGNHRDEPIAIANDDAKTRLAGTADAFLLHDREIVVRCDDSVVRVAGGAPIVLRRARGFAPLPLELPLSTPVPLLAVGAHLKNTFCLAHGSAAYVSQHIGDLENLETLAHFRGSLETLQRLFRIEPQAVVRDTHPGYLSSRIAHDLDLGEPITVQHHHAHVAAVAAEYGITDPVVGAAFDGTGYGGDGAVWGAEILVADLVGFERRCHLRYAPLPGGDLATREPWRSALGYLSLEPALASSFAVAFAGVDPTKRALAERQIHQKINAPLASSMGRLFDAAAAVLGIRRVSRYEAQAAMELEAAAGTDAADPLPFPIERAPDGGWILDPIPLLAALGEGRAMGRDPGDLAAQFHESVAATTTVMLRQIADDAGIATVVLCGGVFQNARLLESVVHRLRTTALTVLVPRRLGPNDGAISFGQAAVGAATLSRRAAAAG